MNGAPVSWKHANRNGDEKIDRDEWTETVDELEQFRAGYQTHGLIAIPIESEGLVAASDVRTLVTDGIPEVPSPVSDGRYVYLVKNGGLLSCVDVLSGELVYRKRTRGTGTHYASPLIADGKLYAFAGNGKVSVIALGDSGRILSVNKIPEPIYATPAIVDGILFLRTHHTLHAFAEASEVRDTRKRVVCLMLLLVLSGRSDAGSSLAEVEPFVQQTCLDCHDESTQTQLDFTSLGRDLGDEQTFRTWVRIYDRMDVGEMPHHRHRNQPNRTNGLHWPRCRPSW